VIVNRTPGGEPYRCPTCGGLVVAERSWPSSDVPCHHCGLLLWSSSVSVSTPASEQFGIGVAADNIEAQIVLAAVLPTLPEPEAEVLRLYHIKGRNFESIGQEMRLSRKEVRRIWAQGVKRLKAVFDRNF
jgi:DNA-directed RNA polymerase specialized sigma24 family protein